MSNGSINTKQSVTGSINLGGGSNYVLPIASANTLGGIKVGANLTIEEDGTLNATANEGTGVAGENGATFTPSVSSDGIISWTNDKGLSNPTPVNIKGEKGEQGIQGADGYTPLKGTDYYTEEDKQEMVDLVLEALPSAEEVSF